LGNGVNSGYIYDDKVNTDETAQYSGGNNYTLYYNKSYNANYPITTFYSYFIPNETNKK
jgi:hypothetical protein